MIKLLLLISLGLGIHASSFKKAERYYKNNNTSKATKYYKKACDEGVKEGCEKYDDLQSPITKAFTLISQHRGEEAMPYLKQACEEGFAWACTMYQSSTGKTATIAIQNNDFKIILDYYIKEKELPQKEAIGIALKYVWGKPILSNLKYDEDKKYFRADLSFDRKKNFHKEVQILVEEDKVTTFQTVFNSLQAEAIFSVNTQKVNLKEVFIQFENKKYITAAIN